MNYMRDVGGSMGHDFQEMIEVRPHEYVQRTFIEHESVREADDTPAQTKTETPFETRFEPLAERIVRVSALNEPREPPGGRKRPFVPRRGRAEMAALRAAGTVPPKRTVAQRATKH